MFYALKSLNDDTDFIKAEDVQADKQNDIYYCPCITCKCRFGFRSMNSNKKRNCFFKLPSSTHSDSCFVPYIKSDEGNKYDYETVTLSAENLLQRLIMPTKESNSTVNRSNKKNGANERLKPITTLRQLYYICASNEPSTKLNEKLSVIDIFAGRNTKNTYIRDIDGIKLVECKFKNKYNKVEQTLYFSYPCDKACFELVVKIDDIKMYYETKNKLWGFSGPVIIYAKWNHSNCTINNKKQIIPLK